MTNVTSAHDQVQHVEVLWHYPDHTARAEDPHFNDFETVIRRLKSQGIYRCVICSTDQSVECHHSHVEYSLQNGVDLQKLNQFLGLHLTDADFVAWIDSPGNLEPLCTKHHRGTEGIHLLPTPAWEALRVWKNGLPLVEAKGNI